MNDSYSSTDITFETDIYSYHWSKGLFTGISLDGGILTYYEKLCDSLYGIETINMGELFYEIETPYNNNVNELLVALNVNGV